jgi:hypothetical protein
VVPCMQLETHMVCCGQCSSWADCSALWHKGLPDFSGCSDHADHGGGTVALIAVLVLMSCNVLQVELQVSGYLVTCKVVLDGMDRCPCIKTCGCAQHDALQCSSIQLPWSCTLDQCTHSASQAQTSVTFNKLHSID